MGIEIEIETGRDRRVQVRWPYNEAATWREAVGNPVPLLAMCCYGPLDAPESMPAGSMMATKHGAWPETAYRGE